MHVHLKMKSYGATKYCHFWPQCAQSDPKWCCYNNLFVSMGGLQSQIIMQHTDILIVELSSCQMIFPVLLGQMQVIEDKVKQ